MLSVPQAGRSDSEQAGVCERRQEDRGLWGRDDRGGVRGGLLRLAVPIIQVFSERRDDSDRTVLKVHLLLLDQQVSWLQGQPRQGVWALEGTGFLGPLQDALHVDEEGAWPILEGPVEGVGLLGVPRAGGAHGTAGGVRVLLGGGQHLRGGLALLPLAQQEVGQASDDEHGAWKECRRSGGWMCAAEDPDRMLSEPTAPEGHRGMLRPPRLQPAPLTCPHTSPSDSGPGLLSG